MTYPITFGKYLLLDRINVGGMAEVFKAKAFGVEGFERILAIKRILPNMADDDEFINMFVDEARIAVQLSHANIVQIYELGKFENQFYIAMEYVSGKDLRQFLDLYRKKKKLVPLPAAAFLISKVCEGLDYAHRKTDPSGKPMNVIHRDVSPQNILASFEGAVKVTDFGIAKAEDRASKTQAGVLKGKFGYMSPEQVRGLDIDQRSDIFAVGILLYEMVTGKRLFIGESDFSTLEKVRNADVVPPREHNPDIPEDLEQIMLKALAKERDERYTYASDLADDLQQFLISDNRIFNAKNLATLLAEDYQDDIDQERARMEEYVKMTGPSPDAFAQAEQIHSHTPRASENWANDKAEKTMIFDSSFSELSDAPTHVGDSIALDVPTGSDVKIPPMSAPAPVESSKSSVSRVSVVRRDTNTGETAGSRNTMLFVLVGLVFVALLVVIFFLVGRGGDTGTILVTSKPTDQVDVFLDGTLIGSRTPITRTDVPAGPHTLLARAEGYRDRAYRFDLQPGGPAIIDVELDKLAGGPVEVTDPSEGPVVLEVITVPAGASVRLGGLPQGITPLSLEDPDTSQPMELELSLEGYETRLYTHNFVPNQPKQKVIVQLKEASGRPPVENPPDGPGGVGTIQVRSRPLGARVFLGRASRGNTPLNIENLDTQGVYEVRLTLDGYKPYSQKVRFNGSPTQTVDAELQLASSRPTKQKTKNTKSKQKTKKKSAPDRPSGGGKCSGSGAKLSVMALGASDCKISVGNKPLGMAPQFKRDAPTGRCEVRVRCADGKSYKEIKNLSRGDSAKVIVKPDMWKK